MLRNDPTQRPDIPLLLENLKNPENSVVRTLTQPSNVIQTEEQSQQCQYCHNMFPVREFVWYRQYLMCSGCCNQYHMQAASQVSAAEEHPRQVYEDTGTTAPPPEEHPRQVYEDTSTTTPPPDITASSMQVCKKCSFQSPMTISQNGTLVWLCGFCFTPHQLSIS